MPIETPRYPQGLSVSLLEDNPYLRIPRLTGIHDNVPLGQIMTDEFWGMLNECRLSSEQKSKVTRALYVVSRNSIGRGGVGELRTMSDKEILGIHQIGEISLLIIRHLFGSLQERESRTVIIK